MFFHFVCFPFNSSLSCFPFHIFSFAFLWIHFFISLISLYCFALDFPVSFFSLSGVGHSSLSLCTLQYQLVWLKSHSELPYPVDEIRSIAVPTDGTGLVDNALVLPVLVLSSRRGEVNTTQSPRWGISSRHHVCILWSAINCLRLHVYFFIIPSQRSFPVLCMTAGRTLEWEGTVQFS